MLTGDLIRARAKGKQLHPQFVDPTHPRVQERAQELVDLVQTALDQGWNRGRLTDAQREQEGTSPDHKLLRGMMKVLLDGCEFEASSPLPPVELRRHVFRTAAQLGPLARRAGPLQRRVAADVLEMAAVGLAAQHPDTPMTPEQLGHALYADLKREHRLVGRKGPVDGPALVHRYNVALVQALLLRASELSIRLDQPSPKHLRALFRYLKFFQLMYRVESLPGGRLALRIDGPESLLKSSTRYGMQLATFLPAILQQPGDWCLEATVLWGRKRKLRKDLVLTQAQGLQGHYKERGLWRSNVEQWFEERFVEVAPEWSLAPGKLIDLGGQKVLVPDFSFEREGRVAHLDIVGYWRKNYLRKRLEQTPDNVVLAVSRRLTGDKTALPKTLQRQVVEFAEIIPAAKVRDRLEAVAR